MTQSLSEQCAAWESRVAHQIGHPRRLGVCYSGGVDSTVLLAVALRHLGHDNVVALLAVSDSLPAEERQAAHRTASSLGATVVEVPTRELDDPAYRANGPDRCYHCKSALFAQIVDDIAEPWGLDAVAYGENADDALRLDRPGARAATDHHILRPLAEAGLTKEMVRSLARDLHLDVSEKPASPCLASRIPHFTAISAENLRQVDLAEQAVRAAGFRDARVRHHGDVARIEIPLEDFPRALSVRDDLLAGVGAAGFAYVTLDLAGMQSGRFTMSVAAHD
ncbi:MAG: ATP-dependent sacrificial sulfur transferase LarE [Propionibacteriaceae bacterium]|nr:ATP-dependent sacrificial sulfur transferase LarE [Propionibacteriaceae bacterium]